MLPRFAKEVRGCIGIPFIEQGRSKHGMDCLGLVMYSLGQCGIHPQSRGDYSIGGENYSDDLVRYMGMACDRIASADEIGVGDIVLFSARACGGAKHVSVITSMSDNAILFTHTTEKLNSVTEELLCDNWKRLMHSIWRIKNG